MKIFKKKIKRSEWMSGLLWAESCIDDLNAYRNIHSYDAILWNGRDMWVATTKDGEAKRIPCSSGFAKGVEDYFIYYRDNLKQHLTSLHEV